MLRHLLITAALPLAAQSGLDIQSGNAADAKLMQLLNARQWPALADHFEALAPKDRDRNAATYLSALQKAGRWERLLEVCPPHIAKAERGSGDPPSMARQLQALALMRLGRNPEAAAAFLEIGRRGDGRAWGNALAAAFDTKDFAFVLQTAEAVLAKVPDHLEATAMKGEALAKLLRAAEAEPLLVTAVAKLPQRAESWTSLAYCQQERGALEEALASATQALALDPQLIEARYNRARALMALKRFPEAREELAAGLPLASVETRPQLETLLAQVDRYLDGQKRKAEREAQKVAPTAKQGRKR